MLSWVSLCLTLFLFLCHSLFITLCLALTLCLSFSVSLSLSLSLFLCLSLSVSVSVSLSLSVSVLLSFSVSVAVAVAMYLSLFLCLSLSLSLSVCLSVCRSVSLSLSLCSYFHVPIANYIGCVVYSSPTHSLISQMSFDAMDYAHYLPIFFHGVREKQEPHKYIARQGLKDMFAQHIHKVVAVIPSLVVPIKEALQTKDTEIISEMLKTLQYILVAGGNAAGVAFVPYYRQILPTLRLFYQKNVNIGDGIYYSQFKRENLGDLIDETLELFETYGGRNSFINIKYMIPTYESKLSNKRNK